MVIWTRWEDVVSGFLREDLGEVGIFQWEEDFGFRFFCGNGELYYCSKLGNKGGVWEETFVIALEDPVDLVII